MIRSAEAAVAELIEAQPRHGPLMLGLCGPQGSGKSTLAQALVARFAPAATFSIDDLYLPRADRQAMARRVHPLFATRGVPATHDISLGHQVLDSIEAGEPVALPRFDKGVDDRVGPGAWPLAPRDCRLFILEGWCVGARPEPAEALRTPINALERDEDAQGIWRTFANEALEQVYQPLFARLSRLVMLKPPSFATVLDWRLQQEHALRAARGAAPGVMDDDAVARFVAHYERLTRHILIEMPARADLVLSLDRDRRCLAAERYHQE